MQDISVFGLKDNFFYVILLKVLKQGICSFISLVLLIINAKVVIKELLSLADLSRT